MQPTIQFLHCINPNFSPCDTPHYQNTPFEIPESWEWVRLGEIFEWNPKTIAEDSTTAGFVSMEMVNGGFGYGHTFEERKWGEVKRGYSHFKNGDIGIAKISPCFENRKSTIFKSLPNGIGAGTTELTVLRSYWVNTEFCLYLFQSVWYISEGTKYFKGVVGQQRVHKDIFTSLAIPIPPLAEQKRIVAEIEKWFALIDKLEVNQQGLQQAIKQVRNKILDLAIHGKLVPQDPNDEPAIDLLRRINPNFTPCDTSHYQNLPNSWQVAPMKMLCDLSDGNKQSGVQRINLDVKFLRGKGEGETLLAGKYIPADSTMILVDGENSGEIFTTPIEGYQGSTFKLLDISSEMYKPFILYIIKSYQKQFRENKVGSAIPHLNKKLFREIDIFIPPYEEQKQIVKQIDKLFATLDTISAEL